MGLINDAARRQLAWYVRSCLTSPAAHFLEAAAISQLDVLRGETDDADDYFTETRVTNRRCKLRELHSLLCGLGAAPRGDQQFERNIAFVRKEFGLDAIDTEILLLLLRYESNPAIEAFVDRVAANAARAAALAGGGEAEIEQAISRVLPLLGIAPQFADAHGHEFGPALVNCGVDLAALAERLTRPGAPAGWSLCVHGLPGTGKSQFARHLAARLGLEVMQQRASDLLSMWVGGSEKAIAAAFAAARSQRAMLIFDEADSLLSDRREASHSWEVTQVNEMLTWMESHPLPFVCTTNLPDRLDRASLRRFTLKLRFDPLDPAQAARAFRHFFMAEPPLVLPDGLTPGDFATVRRKLALYGDASPGLLADWLMEEVEAKGLPAQPIGFAVA